jgi:uncharacterized protein (DUF2384 family)
MSATLMTVQTTNLTPTRTTAHSKSIGDGLDDILRTLVLVLGKKVVADIVKKDVRTVQRWQSGKGAAVGVENERILRDVFQIYTLISTVDSDATARAWFLGMNPLLDDHSPVDVLIEGQARSAVAAARAFVNGA